MRNTLLIALGIIGLGAWSSCKEQPVAIDMSTNETWDTTYVVATIESPQDKKYLIEELSGVQCTNCPAGMVKLTELNTTGNFANKLVIASIHVGTFAWEIEGYSKQNFVAPYSAQLLELILGGDPGKPCASFDRLNMGTQGSLLMPSYNQWAAFLNNAGDSANTTPVNITIQTAPTANSDEYEVTVKAHYTGTMDDQQMLSVYIVENKIIDAMKYTREIDTAYEFKHVLRSYLTPPSGRQIMRGESVTPGRVYEYKTYYKIDKSNATEALWNADNMNVIAFISSGSTSTKRVYQAQEVKLIP